MEKLNRNRITEKGIKYSLTKYKNYSEYKKVQEEASIKKESGSWVVEENIKYLSEYLLKIMKPEFGICHGTRRGKEQEWFMKYLPGCDVVGTEISELALRYPNTIQWDFHKIKKEWTGKFDFIYSNSFDHSYKPKECLLTWLSCLNKNGVCILEHSCHHTKSSKTDCFGIGLKDLVDIVPYWTDNKYAVVNMLDAVVVRQKLSWLNFLIIKGV